MKAALLEDVEKLVVREIPDPAVGPREVLIRVHAVGICGTDLHLFHGHGNYNFDARGRSIPLTVQPQLLGHEFSGEILEVGRDVRDLKPGDRVLCDQGRNCHSQGREPLCPYCRSGDSHQCEHYGEHGITGLPGALADFIAMPALNCLRLPDGMPWDQAALVEPLGCVTHSCDQVDRALSRYRFGGDEPIRNVLICGGGPAGLLFLQYLRHVKQFDGLLMVADRRQKNLDLVERLGGTPLNVEEHDLSEAVLELTRGERLHYIIEACGDAGIFARVPGLLRKQGTVLIYGAGHRGHDISLLDPILFLEPTLVAAVGASGGFDAEGRPTTYRRALEMVSSGKVQVLPFITHRYRALEEIHNAFERDSAREDYIKGVLDRG
jgi:L-iditol 2-dehydrogenase